ncbi:chemotaxis protein CheW [bacterium]|nr:chemotaxis protein CheW [bacterium]
MANTFLIFTLEEHYFALDIAEVIRVYPALAIDRLSEGPELVSGIFTVAGKKIPVLDLRQRLHLPARVVTLEDVLVLGESDEVEFAFFVDAVAGVYSFVEEELSDTHTIHPEMAGYASRVTEFSEHTVWIYTLKSLFAEQDFPALMEMVADESS